MHASAYPRFGQWFMIGGMFAAFVLTAPLSAEEEGQRQREQIGEVQGKPVYRDEIRTGEDVQLRHELLRLFGEPVAQKFYEAHKDEIEPTEDEIAQVTAHFNETNRERAKETERGWRAHLEQVEKQLANPELTEEERHDLEKARRCWRPSFSRPVGDSPSSC